MNDRESRKLRGSVRTLRTELAEWDGTRGEWLPPRFVTILTFRTDGQVAEEESHNPDGSIVRTTRLYDEKARIREADCGTIDGQKTRTIYAYDESGRPISSVHEAADGTSRQLEEISYDASGRQMRRSFVGVPGVGLPLKRDFHERRLGYSVPEATTFATVHDEHERLVEIHFEGSDGRPLLRVTLTRDPEGRLLDEASRFAEPGFFVPMDTIPVDERGHLEAALQEVFSDNTFSRTTYEYDSKGLLVAQMSRMGVLSEDRTTFEHDDRGNPIVEHSETHSREIGGGVAGQLRIREDAPRWRESRYEYHYDAQGNWLERIASWRTSPTHEFSRSNIERRAIDYYED